jgi:hypothetical protein
LVKERRLYCSSSSGQRVDSFGQLHDYELTFLIPKRRQKKTTPLSLSKKQNLADNWELASQNRLELM